MKSPASRAAALCGGLVGGCSALLSSTAHAAAGGMLPGGAAMVVLVVACAVVGATTCASLRTDRHARLVVLVGGLTVGQAVGHAILAVAESHHGLHGVVPSAPMLAAHAAAALVLGVLIGLTGHLYVVCASVLSWLALVPIHRGRPSLSPWGGAPIVVLSQLLHSRLRMRAPPIAVH